MSAKTTDPAAKLRDNIKVDSKGCWLWQRCVNSDGYGSIRYNGKTWRTHRLAYTAFKEPIPKGLHVLHSCDTPACCNPEHLSLGTHQDNMRDRGRKGRSNGGSLKGELNKATKHSDHFKQLVIDFNGTHSEAARFFDISRTTAYQWRTGLRRKT